MFAEDVPEGDVDCRSGGGDDGATFEILGAVEDLVNVLNATRVLADEEFTEMVDGAGKSPFAPSSAGFSEPVDASVSFDLDYETASKADLDREVLDTSDFQGESPPLRLSPS